jgi:hypothetical protein
MKVTPVLSRSYSRTATLAATYKGKQRQIVAAILRSATEPLTPEQVAKLAEEAGLTAVGGVLPSVRYHLHHLCLLGEASYEAPAVEEQKAA